MSDLCMHCRTTKLSMEDIAHGDKSCSACSHRAYKIFLKSSVGDQLCVRCELSVQFNWHLGVPNVFCDRCIGRLDKEAREAE